MKYEKEVDEALRLICFESWMNEDDYNNVVNDTLKEIGSSKQKMNDDIQKGVDNGYSVELQMELIRLKYKQK